MPAELDDLFDRTASLAARPRTVSELPGGLTNRNYQIRTRAGACVARISSGGSELLAIDRDCEHQNSVTAAAAGAGPPVVEYRPQDSTLILGYIQGHTLTAAARARRLHEGGRFGNDFDMFDIQRRYLSAARSRGFKIPAGYDDLRPQCEAAEKALGARPTQNVPCHHSPLGPDLIG